MKTPATIDLKNMLFSLLIVLLLPFSLSSQNTLIHFWYFSGALPNNMPFEEVNATYSLTDHQANLEFQSALEGYPFDPDHPNWRKASMERRNSPTEINYRPIANQGLPYEASQMRGLQIKQPFADDGRQNTMIFHLPTTGYNNIVFQFAALDEGAADALRLDYSYEGPEPQWTTQGLESSTLALDDTYALYTINFSASGKSIMQANDNPHFMIRIRFEGNDLSADDGNRVTFNNVSLDGWPLDDTNLPPLVDNPVALQKLIELSTATTLNLNDVFSDPDNDPLTFSASTTMPAFVQATTQGSDLVLTPLRRGEATITVSASDGENPPVSNTFRVLVYPKAFDLSGGDFAFDQWDNSHPEYTYPENMIFLQSDISDPEPSYDLLFPYYIPHNDYHADDQETIGFPYNNTGRTRINGLGVGGFTFINTGRDRDLGGALVALNTEGQDNLSLSFTAGTMLQNSRIYAFRLMYRIGVEGPFTNVLSGGNPVEYIAGLDGDLQNFSNVNLPPQMMGQPYVQLMWRYYLHSGDAGPRSMLRLDDIVISRSTHTETVALEDIHVFSNNGRIIVSNPAARKLTTEVYDLTGRRVYLENLTGVSQHALRHHFVAGVYIVRVVSNESQINHKVLVW